jgi:DNA polymerase-3 subunit alpha (Gram-positive type)
MQKLDSYVVLDLETTGLDPKTGAEIMEFGAVRVENRKIVAEYETLIKPKQNPPAEIEILTGIRASDLQDAPDLESVRTKITEFIGDLPIIGHNISFDLDFLKHFGFEIQQGNIDTCALATTLIPKVASFSLETLADFFSLPEEEAHRAIGDVRTTQRLFENLRKIAGQSDTKSKQKIVELSEKINWLPGMIFVEEENDFSVPQPKTESKTENEVEIPEDLPEKTLVSIPPQSEKNTLKKISKKFAEPTLIITRNSVEAGELTKDFEKSAMLFAPSAYLDHAKLEKFTENLKPDEEIKLYFWVKILLWESRTETGSTSELIFQRNDYPLWLEIGAESADCPYFEKALEESQDKKVVFSTLRSVFDSPDVFSRFQNIIILGTEELDFRITQMSEQKIFSDKIIDFLQKHLPDENLLNSVDLFFGLAGAMVKNYTPDSLYPVHEIINTTTQFSPEYKRLQEASENLIHKFEKSGFPFLLEASEILRRFFQTSADIVSWITVYPNGNVSLHSNRADLDSLLSQALNLPTRKNIVFLSEHFFSAVMDFLHEELGLGGYEAITAKAKERTSPMRFGLPEEEIAPDNWKSEKNMQDFLENKFLTENRPTIVIFSAKKILKQYFEYFHEQINQANRMLLAEGCTGGVGKILHKFATNEKPILFISERTFRRVELPKTDDLLVFLHKLPFEWASPVNQARMRKYENDFMGFSLPQALLKFDKLVTRSSHLVENSGNFYCLDRRITEKRYGENFAKILEYRDKN